MGMNGHTSITSITRYACETTMCFDEEHYGGTLRNGEGTLRDIVMLREELELMADQRAVIFAEF